MLTDRLRRGMSLFLLLIAASGHAAETATYTYDSLGRLTTVQTAGGPADGSTVSYQLDPAGNRTQHSSTRPTGSTPVSVNPPSSVTNATGVGVTLIVNVGSASAVGTVTFTEGGVFLGSAAVINGQATIILEDYPQGLHTITASYSGDSVHAPASATYQIRVQNLAWLPAVLNLLLE
jgi:YD repeat-containing protein